MDIVIGVPRRVEVEHVAHPLHVEPARGDIGTAQDVDRAVLEPVKLGDPRGLIHVAMDFPGGKAVLLQVFSEIAHSGLAVGKDHRGRDIVGPQQFAQHFALLARFDMNLVLGDLGVVRRRTGDFDIFGIGQELVRQLLDHRRHGRAEQHGLAGGGQLRTDRFDIGNEPHVEHPVRFVDHQQVATGQQDLAAFEQVHQAAWGGDQHVNAVLQRLDLIAHLHAADQQRHLQIVVLAVFLEILCHLRGEFAGRLQDQAARHQRAAAAMCQNVDHWQNKAGGFAGARLRDSDQILHHQHGRDRLGLNRGGRIVSRSRHGLQQFVGKAEIGKCHRLYNIRKKFGVPAPGRTQGSFRRNYRHETHGSARALGANVRKSQEKRVSLPLRPIAALR